VRLLIALVVIVYLVGVGVVLAPTIQSGWDHLPASDLASTVFRVLPDALAWPAKAYRSLTGQS